MTLTGKRPPNRDPEWQRTELVQDTKALMVQDTKSLDGVRHQMCVWGGGRVDDHYGDVLEDSMHGGRDVCVGGRGRYDDNDVLQDQCM